MPPSIFVTLCNLCDELDTIALGLDPGTVQDRLRELVQRFDQAIDRTIGLECPTTPAEED